MDKKLTAEQLLERYASGERDFSGANLDELDLAGADLRGINLSGASLLWTDLRNANLSHANLMKSKLDGTISEEAILIESNLKGSRIEAIETDGANFRGADLSDTNISAGWINVDLSYVDFSSSSWDHTGCIPHRDKYKYGLSRMRE